LKIYVALKKIFIISFFVFFYLILINIKERNIFFLEKFGLFVILALTSLVLAPTYSPSTMKKLEPSNSYKMEKEK